MSGKWKAKTGKRGALWLSATHYPLIPFLAAFPAGMRFEPRFFLGQLVASDVCGGGLDWM